MSEPTVYTQARQPRAWVSYSIIAICAGVFALEWAIPTFLGRIALSGLSGAAEPWRFLTSAFAHSKNPAHILFNMYALWALGPTLEALVGRLRFGAIYLISALAGSVAFVWTSPPVDWVVGASGAVFGLFGATLVFTRLVGASNKSLWVIVFVNFALGFVLPNIAWQAHVGGFLAGGVSAYLIGHEARLRAQGKPANALGWLAALLAFVVVVAAAHNLLV